MLEKLNTQQSQISNNTQDQSNQAQNSLNQQQLEKLKGEIKVWIKEHIPADHVQWASLHDQFADHYNEVVKIMGTALEETKEEQIEEMLLEHTPNLVAIDFNKKLLKRTGNPQEDDDSRKRKRAEEEQVMFWVPQTMKERQNKKEKTTEEKIWSTKTITALADLWIDHIYEKAAPHQNKEVWGKIARQVMLKGMITTKDKYYKAALPNSAPQTSASTPASGEATNGQ